jgi:hypothetical protein
MFTQEEKAVVTPEAGYPEKGCRILTLYAGLLIVTGHSVSPLERHLASSIR